MLRVEKEQNPGGPLILRLSGTIDEKVDFERQLGTPPAGTDVHVYCKEVPRINSHGIREWVIYFEKLARLGNHVTFHECSPAIVQQFELVVNFVAAGKVESICLPYICRNCKSPLITVMKVAEVRKLNLAIPDQKCPRCQGVAVFDDIPVEYLSFLSRIKA